MVTKSFKELPEGSKHFFGLVTLTIAIFLLFFLLNTFFYEEIISETLITEDEEQANPYDELLNSIFKKKLNVYESTDGYLLNTDEYKILDCINKQSDSIQTLYLFGHNPGLNSLVNKLTNQNLSNIPTTGICIIEVESFENLKLGTGQLIDFLYPKQYK